MVPGAHSPAVISALSVHKDCRDLTAWTLLLRQCLAPAHSGDFGEPLTLSDTWSLHLKNRMVRLDQVLFSNFDHTHVKKYISQCYNSQVPRLSGLTRKVHFSHTCNARSPGLWVALLHGVIQGPSHLDSKVDVTFNHISKRQTTQLCNTREPATCATP